MEERRNAFVAWLGWIPLCVTGAGMIMFIAVVGFALATDVHQIVIQAWAELAILLMAIGSCGPMIWRLAVRRRWFAFRLRTLLVLIAAVALLCGWVVWDLRHMREQRVLMLSYLRRGAGFSMQSTSRHNVLPRPSDLLFGASSGFDFLGDIQLPRSKFTEVDQKRLQDLTREVDVLLIDGEPVLTVPEESIAEMEAALNPK